VLYIGKHSAKPKIIVINVTHFYCLCCRIRLYVSYYWLRYVNETTYFCVTSIWLCYLPCWFLNWHWISLLYTGFLHLQYDYIFHTLLWNMCIACVLVLIWFVVVQRKHTWSFYELKKYARLFTWPSMHEDKMIDLIMPT
jgi:hypothetical protein